MAVDFAPLVEIDFTSTGVWVDVTPWVRLADGDNIRIMRGRGDEQSEVRPGTLSFVLDNRDGRFTPGNDASPYWPNVRKGRPIRVSIVVDGTPYRRFRGFVNEWPVTFAGGGQLVLSAVTATDVFKRLGRVGAMRSLLEEEMLALGPDRYHTLGEPAGSTSAGDTSGNGAPPLGIATYGAGAADTLKFGEATGPGTDGLPAVLFAPTTSTDGRILAVSQKPPTGTFVAACWMNTTVKGRAFMAFQCWTVPGIGVWFKTDPTSGALLVGANNGKGSSIGASLGGGANLADGATHLVAVMVAANGDIHASVDGGPTVLVINFAPDSLGPWINLPVYDRVRVGGNTEPDGSPTLHVGAVSHFWYAQRATMPDWSRVWEAGNPETTPDRFERLCDLLGITGTVEGTSDTVIGGQAAGDDAPVQALRTVAKVEAGIVYASRADDSVVFECRNHRYNRASSLTLAAIREDDLTWSDDDQYVVNDVTNSRTDGAAQRWTDAASVAAYGTYKGGDRLPWDSDADALYDAQWRVSNGADPPPRITRFTVVGNALASYTTILGLDISDVVTLDDLPPGSPVSSADVHIEGYSELIEFNYHAISFNTSPASVSKVWQLGVPGSSEIGVNTRLAL